jgi:hypothetical protein
MCREYVTATTHADYRGTTCMANVVGQISHVVFQEVKLPESPSKRYMAVPAEPSIAISRCSMTEEGVSEDGPHID